MMPIMNGYEVCEKLRKMQVTANLPIIMVSAKHESTDVVEGLLQGANDYVSKPFSKLELLARIRTQIKLAKTYQLQMEKEKSDSLLKSMLPESIISRLKGGQHLIADRYERVTILFSDIVGFTTLASQIPAEVCRVYHQ